MAQPFQRMSVVPNDFPEPPYPSGVRANGWRFELDMERVRQSSTWKLCPPHMRAHLLRLWAEAWTSAPCGSLESEDEIVALTLEIPLDLFQLHRKHLMRGWFMASDGRLYHPVLTELVEKMRDGRRSEREKKARQRSEKKQGLSELVPGDSQGNPEGVPVESPGCPPTGTGSGTGITTPISPIGELGVVVAGEAVDLHPWRKVARTCPHQKIVALYAELFPAGPEVSIWDERRQGYSRARWREQAEANQWPDEAAGLHWFAKFFRYAARSDFLTGRAETRGDRKPFLASLEWLLRPTNFRNVVEGKYE